MKKIIIIVAQLLFVMGISAQTQQELRDSLSMINKLIEEHPRAVKLHLRKAALNIALEQWDYALEEYDKVIDIMPSNLNALYYRGFVYQHLKRWDFARKDYEQVLRSDPMNANAHTGLILTNLYDGHKTKAFDGANKLISFFPGDSRSYAIRSEVEDYLGLTDLAIDDIMKAIEIETPKTGSIITEDDDIFTYKITACNLFIKTNNKRLAKQQLDYLVEHHIPKALLSEYYQKIKK